MIDGKFDVIFRGQTVKGMELSIVKENLAKVFKSSHQAIEKLFAGGEVVIKRQLDYSAAMKYQSALRQAGALALIKESEGSTSQLPPRQEPASSKASFVSRETSTAEYPSSNTSAAEAPSSVSSGSAQDHLSTHEPDSGEGLTLTIAEVGADILPPKVYEQKDVDTSALSVAPPGERLLPPKPPEKHLTPNIEHLRLLDP